MQARPVVRMSLVFCSLYSLYIRYNHFFKVMLCRTFPIVTRAQKLRSFGTFSRIFNQSIDVNQIKDLPVQVPVNLQYTQYKGRNEVDDSKPPITMLHGLFGEKQNFRTVGRKISDELGHPVFGIDLRNHGDSPRVEPHDYDSMTADVIKLFKENNWKDTIVIGHSMGAKVAMLIALKAPELVSKLVVVDNSPVNAPLNPDFRNYLFGLCQIELELSGQQFENRSKLNKASDPILSPYAEDKFVRAFLLSNLTYDKLYKLRVPVLNFYKQNVLANLGKWPLDSPVSPFTKPVKLMKAQGSNYITDEYINNDFPKYFTDFLVDKFDCGHWLITEAPNDFVKRFSDFATQ